MLILAVPEYLDELLEDGCLATVATLRELGGIVVMTINLAFMFVVAVFGTEDGRAYRTGKMFDVIFPFQRSDVGASESTAALEAEKIKSPEVVRLAERILAVSIFVVYRKELGGYNLSAILQVRMSERDYSNGPNEPTHFAPETVQVIGRTERPHELSGQRLRALLTRPERAA